MASVARGDLRMDEGDEPKRSPIPDVGDEAWTQFVCGMEVAEPGEVSESNGVGMFAMMPRRLADLGLVKNLARSKKGDKTVWVGAFVPPLTDKLFLKSPEIQYSAFARSMRDYADRIKRGDIALPEDTSLSGALAVLHRAGPSGLKTWVSGDRFPATQRAHERVAGIF